MSGRRNEDVVDLLTAQHEQIGALLDRLRADHDDKQGLFAELVRLVAVHESAEEEIVHPVARRCRFGADDIVKHRLTEERAVKHALAELRDLGVDHPEFDEKLAKFADAVASHAANEEAEEFTMLRKQFSANQLEKMAASVRQAEAVAPTRLHPHAGESPLANLFAGPPLALFDRARDTVRHWRRGQDR